MLESHSQVGAQKYLKTREYRHSREFRECKLHFGIISVDTDDKVMSSGSQNSQQISIFSKYFRDLIRPDPIFLVLAHLY